MGGQGDTRLQRTASVTVARLRSSPAISPRRMRERDEARLGVIILAAAASARPVSIAKGIHGLESSFFMQD